MEWWLVFSLIIGLFVFFLALGVPVALAFFAGNLVGLYFFGGGTRYFNIMAVGMYDGVNSFILVAVPLFVVMGEVLFRCGFINLITDAFDAIFGRLPGRLGLLTIGTGTVLGALSGANVATAATLGTTIVPDMIRQGYRPWLAYGSALGGGALAVLIPPSTLAIVVAFVGEISPGKVLIGGAIPGLLTSALFIVFILLICKIRPNLAPESGTMHHYSPMGKVLAITKSLPLLSIVFLVTVVIFLGVATPTEAAALGASGSIVLALIYKRLNWTITTASLLSTVKTTAMIFLIIAGSRTFSQVLTLSGASSKLVQTTVGLPLEPLVIVGIMMLIVLLLGCFMDSISLVMITIPIFMPTIIALGLDPIWFAVLVVIGLGIAGITPPVGLLLYAMKAVCPSSTIGEIYRGAVPFFTIQIIVMFLTVLFPAIGTFLPGLMN